MKSWKKYGLNISTNKNNDILAIIPARGGSKGLYRKNIKELYGKPLIAYSIEVALRTEFIDRVVVSTEDEEIAEISRNYGAEVPFLRPESLAGDKSSIGDAINYTTTRLAGIFPRAVITLLPTQPFRSLKLMNHLVEKSMGAFGKVITVSDFSIHSNSHIIMDDNGFLKPIWGSFFHNEGTSNRTLFRFNGLYSAYIPANSQQLQYTHIVEDPIASIDIDSQEDFMLAEEIIKENLFDFN